MLCKLWLVMSDDLFASLSTSALDEVSAPGRGEHMDVIGWVACWSVQGTSYPSCRGI